MWMKTTSLQPLSKWKVIFQPNPFTDQMLFSHTKKSVRTISWKRETKTFLLKFIFLMRGQWCGKWKQVMQGSLVEIHLLPCLSSAARCRALLLLLRSDAPAAFAPEGKQDSCGHRALQKIPAICSPGMVPAICSFPCSQLQPSYS